MAPSIAAAARLQRYASALQSAANDAENKRVDEKFRLYKAEETAIGNRRAKGTARLEKKLSKWLSNGVAVVVPSTVASDEALMLELLGVVERQIADGAPEADVRETKRQYIEVTERARKARAPHLYPSPRTGLSPSSTSSTPLRRRSLTLDVSQGHLGVTLINSTGDLSGVLVSWLNPNDLLASAGLGVGDCIVTIHGTPVTTHEAAFELFGHVSGPITLEYIARADVEAAGLRKPSQLERYARAEAAAKLKLERQRVDRRCTMLRVEEDTIRKNNEKATKRYEAKIAKQIFVDGIKCVPAAHVRDAEARVAGLLAQLEEMELDMTLEKLGTPRREPWTEQEVNTRMRPLKSEYIEAVEALRKCRAPHLYDPRAAARTPTVTPNETPSGTPPSGTPLSGTPLSGTDRGQKPVDPDATVPVEVWESEEDAAAAKLQGFYRRRTDRAEAAATAAGAEVGDKSGQAAELAQNVAGWAVEDLPDNVEEYD